METHISLLLTNLSLPYGGDLKTGLIEITIDNKKEIVNYPQQNPISLTLSSKFIKDKQLICINIKSKTQKKYKNIARGELVLYKKNIIEGGGNVEKNIIMIQSENQNDFSKINKNNMGKIHIKISLEESFDDWKKKAFPLNKTSSTTRNKAFKKKMNDSQNEIKKKNNFDDNLSEITASNIDNNTENIENVANIENVNMNEIEKMKDLLEKNYKNILPNDINELKEFTENLYDQFQDLTNNYLEVLSQNDIKKNEIKQIAKKNWDDYKKSKKILNELRIDYQNKQKYLNENIENNKNNKNSLDESIQAYMDKNNVIMNKIFNDKISTINIKANNPVNNIDITNMINLLKKLKSLGYKVEEGMNGDEIKQLNLVLGEENNNQGENGVEEDEDDELGTKIVSLIERDVNELYVKKIIEKIKIDQIDSETYTFSNDKLEKSVKFKVENNNLICDNGDTFLSWVVANFGL